MTTARRITSILASVALLAGLVNPVALADDKSKQHKRDRHHDDRGDRDRDRNHRDRERYERDDRHHGRHDRDRKDRENGRHDRRDRDHGHRDRHDRRDWKDHRRDHRDWRKDRSRDWKHDRYHDWQRQWRKDHRKYQRDQRHLNKHWRKPYVYFSPYDRHWRDADRRYYQHKRGYYTNHYYRDYSPRYRIGGYYHYSPRSVVIRDYSRYGLYHPPHGHHWVRDNDRGDAILASVATGAIIGLVVGILAYD